MIQITDCMKCTKCGVPLSQQHIDVIKLTFKFMNEATIKRFVENNPREFYCPKCWEKTH
jgi:hypothetical protein